MTNAAADDLTEKTAQLLALDADLVRRAALPPDELKSVYKQAAEYSWRERWIILPLLITGTAGIILSAILIPDSPNDKKKDVHPWTVKKTVLCSFAGCIGIAFFAQLTIDRRDRLQDRIHDAAQKNEPKPTP